MVGAWLGLFQGRIDQHRAVLAAIAMAARPVTLVAMRQDMHVEQRIAASAAPRALVARFLGWRSQDVAATEATLGSNLWIVYC
jgi:uncharacterized MnhB-related membrane protein